jgi:glutathione synthase/RimK-type ligase-like ATP-grasp enzyme
LPPSGGLQAILKGATFSTRYLVDEHRYRLVNFMVAEDNILNYSELPAHALVINSVTDPDVEMGVLETISKFLKRQPNIPFINDPLKAAETSRDRNYQRLNKMEDVLFSTTIRLTVDEELLAGPAKKVEDMGFTYPVLVRNTGTHTGQTFVRAETPKALTETLEERLGTEIYLIQFVEAFYRGKYFRKMRVFFIDGEVYPVVHHIDDFWNVHGGNRKEVMAEHDWMMEKEKAYVSDCHAYLGDEPYAILRQLIDIIGLDFCGVDFTITDEGKLLIFELNPTMRHSFDHARKFKYLIEPHRNITAAFNRMIENRLA